MTEYYFKYPWMTQKLLKDTLTYNESGHFYWRKDRPVEHFATMRGYNVFMSQWAGGIAGKIAINSERDTRDIIISYHGQIGKFCTHQLVFLYHHGYVPSLIDHIDGDYLNNKIENLQELNPQLNTTKATMFSHNTTGYRGVRYRPRDNKYIVNIKVDGKGYYCGQYACIHYAAAVYNYASKSIFGDYGFLNKLKQDVNFNPEDIDNVFFNEHLPLLNKSMDVKYGTERKYKRQ